MSQAMAPADHVFVSALSALVLTIVRDRADHLMLIDCASQVEPRVNMRITALADVARAFSAWREARKAGRPGHSEWFDLSGALQQFHRWRVGAAQAAMGN